MTASPISRTWVAAGVLLIVSTIVPLVIQTMTVSIVGLSLFDALLFAAALGLLAFGSPSVTARRPLGTTALVALGVWTVIDDGIVLLGPGVSVALGMTFGYVYAAVWFALAVIAAVSVSRAGVVPSPWRLSGLWALAAVVGPLLVVGILGVSVTTRDAAAALYPLATLFSVAAGLFLGVLAIVLGITRPRIEADSTEPVFSGRAADRP